MKSFASLLSFVALVQVACADLFPAADYVVYRNVKDYGAVGDGVADDTAAIIRALTKGRADVPTDVYPNAKYSPSTTKPAYVYFPAGTYKVTQSLPVVFYTQMVGEETDRPVIKFVSSSTVDQRVLEAAGAWYTGVNQNNFYRLIRNFVVDMTECMQCTGVHWQVAQATSISNVFFKSGIGSNNQGMWMENGSGGYFCDLEFEGGKFGLWVGNQQFTIRNITVRDTSIAGILVFWDWVWTFKNVHVSNSPIGIDVASEVGSINVIDSSFSSISNVPIRTVFDKTSNSSANSVMLDNVKFDVEIGKALVQNNQGEVALKADESVTVVKAWGQGHIWQAGQKVVNGEIDLSSRSAPRSPTLAPNGLFFERSRPYYSQNDVINVSAIGIVGDGQTDITANLQSALLKYAGVKALYFPHGTYIISDTVVVPAGTRMFGQVWSVLMAKGTAFQDAAKPIPMLQIGKPGDTGVAELSDFVISTYGPQPGAKLIEWNMHDPVGQPAVNGMWDVHFRIGGAVGTDIRHTNCPFGDGSSAPEAVCAGAWALLHLTKTSSCYLENVWGWAADHDIDGGADLNVYNHRGLLCESQGPVWMYGTAMEHSVLYQYNFVGSQDVVMFTIQTETPYYQPSSKTPFSTSDVTDPSYCSDDYRCNMSWALRIKDSNNIILYGSGLYSFFNVWDQACLKSSPVPSCQRDIILIESSSELYLHDLNTYGSLNMLTHTTPYSAAVDNPSTFCVSSLVDLDYSSSVNPSSLSSNMISVF